MRGAPRAGQPRLPPWAQRPETAEVPVIRLSQGGADQLRHGGVNLTWSAQVRAVLLQEVKGVEECLGLVPPMSEHMWKAATPPLIIPNHLAVDQAGPAP
jgi:hypothetical protein